jgi:hypothetical protein
MKKWLRETHGPFLELLRHFLRRLFDSDLVTAPGQATGVLIGAIPVFFQWFFPLVGPLRHKYAYLSQLPTAGRIVRLMIPLDGGSRRKYTHVIR